MCMNSTSLVGGGIQGDHNVKTPCIIISASGMVSGGRVCITSCSGVAGYAHGSSWRGFRRRAHAARFTRRRKIAELLRQDVPGGRGDRGYAAIFRARGKSELLRWLTALPGATQADLSDPRRNRPLRRRFRQPSRRNFQWKAAWPIFGSVPVGE